MRLPEPPPDAILVGAARTVSGDEWIRERGNWVESHWWMQMLEHLHKRLLTEALTPGPVVQRTIRFDENHRTVTLLAETWGHGVVGAEWGLPLEVRRTLAPPCPNGGDMLVIPQ